MTGEFHTADVGFVAFLRCRGIRYKRLELNPTDLTIADFVFDESDTLFAAMYEWGDPESECWVDAREYGRLKVRLMRTARQYAVRALN